MCVSLIAIGAGFYIKDEDAMIGVVVFFIFVRLPFKLPHPGDVTNDTRSLRCFILPEVC